MTDIDSLLKAYGRSAAQAGVSNSGQWGRQTTTADIHRNELQKQHKALVGKFTELAAENERLRDYACHKLNCSWYRAPGLCDCGLDSDD